MNYEKWSDNMWLTFIMVYWLMTVSHQISPQTQYQTIKDDQRANVKISEEYINDSQQSTKH